MQFLCRESILEVIRNSMPIEHILRAYMDETTYDEIIRRNFRKTGHRGRSRRYVRRS